MATKQKAKSEATGSAAKAVEKVSTAAEAAAKSSVDATKAAAAESKTAIDEAQSASEAVGTAGTEAVVNGLEQAMLITKQQADKASQFAAKNMEDVTRAGRSSYETWMKSGETLIQGLEKVNRSWFDYAQGTVDANVNVAKQLLGCTTVNEAWALQANHIKASVDGLMAESARVGELTASTLNQAMTPIGAQFKGGLAQVWKPKPAA